MKGRGRNIAMVLCITPASCGGVAAESHAPPAIEQLMEADFPTDGQIHVQRRGAFRITPKTVVCYFPDGFSVDSQALFRALGQTSVSPGGSDRQIVMSDYCAGQPAHVAIKGVQLRNRNGRPYKLVLAVWQGDPTTGGAVWVGGVERLEGRYPEKPLLRGLEGEPLDPAEELERQIRNSINFDTHGLSNDFVSYLTEGQ